MGIAGVTGVSALATGLVGCGSMGQSIASDKRKAATGALPAAAASVLQQVGVQLYTLRDMMDEDVEGALEAVAETGYETVETAGLHGLSAQDFRQLLDRYDLRAPSGHYDLSAMRDDLGSVIETAHTLGHEYVVNPWIVKEERQSIEDYRAIAGEFNRIGEYLQEAGLQFGYHNHDFEFEKFGGDTWAYDVLIRNTDPELVTMELDVYWAYKAGRDPAAYFERYPGRFELAHLKGGTASPEKEMTDVGAGAIDYPGLFRQAKAAGLTYTFVEQDHPDDALASIRASYKYLSALRG